ncbi:Schizosaccharomyces specific protein [Schizosaccharomyces osmophilus]|uniref:Schizosaccharomyces specific protein n=1 Tax=Schizosaccharomyces osmophilus TaxID=2545709 RepID=A0AAE9W6Y1_9SCHI|nr:Schizosaccharomyces specific protein [Schizosaccharomyces osmophilus]WBW71107.1 Schizosaccharomyces specific protein [Schizosaccharomyces osmophilus]
MSSSPNSLPNSDISCCFPISHFFHRLLKRRTIPCKSVPIVRVQEATPRNSSVAYEQHYGKTTPSSSSSSPTKE